MKRQLSEMTLQELWELFPIFLTEHKAEWASWYEEEHDRLQSLLPEKNILRISHIGSTAIHGIWAKPIIDILAELREGCDLNEVGEMVRYAGYTLMGSDKRRLSFNKGYTPDGFAERVFHLHVRYHKDNDELYFRDYLNHNPGAAKEYERLKLELWKKYEHDRDGYTKAKGDFVKCYTSKAKSEFEGRYR